ncbi:MAG: glycerophosphodiester phosphodiesterase [Terriglobales bacterium]
MQATRLPSAKSSPTVARDDTGDGAKPLKQGNKQLRPLLIGHRGARRYAPENTIAAFDLTLEHGCDGFEFDLRRTADGRAVVCHDPRLYRLEICRTPYGAVVARCPTLCTLEDVLTRYAMRAFLYIELKVAGLEREVLSALAEHKPGRGYVIASFQKEVLCAARELDAAVPLGYICDQRRALPAWCELPVQYVMPKQSLVTRGLVSELHGGGKQVFVWTVNRQDEMLAAAEMGVDGILSDDTALLGRVLTTWPFSRGSSHS